MRETIISCLALLLPMSICVAGDVPYDILEASGRGDDHGEDD